MLKYSAKKDAKIKVHRKILYNLAQKCTVLQQIKVYKPALHQVLSMCWTFGYLHNLVLYFVLYRVLVNPSVLTLFVFYVLTRCGVIIIMFHAYALF